MPIEENIEQNIPLAQFTSIKIGGPAKYFVVADSPEEIIEAINWAKSNGYKFFILGGGSNLLISDKGFDGLVIKNVSGSILREKIPGGVRIHCDSGLPMARVVLSARRNGIAGMEWAVGLPGTVGGAIRGNAGCFGSDMSVVLETVEAYDIEKGQIVKLTPDQCKFAYRHSLFKEQPNLIVLRCTLKLKFGKAAEIESEMDLTAKLRAQKAPRHPSAGSVFKNIPFSAIESNELIEEAKSEGKVAGAGPAGVPAGWIIEKLHLKGKQVGGAMVSTESANVIVNRNFAATAEDVLILISLIKQKVRVELHLQLIEEITFVDN